MNISAHHNCHCDSKNSFSDCCKPLLTNVKRAKTPVQLMRSRFTAYKLGGYGEYLLKTWFPLTSQDVSAAELSQQCRNWQQLKIINKSQQGDNGFVEFEAQFLDVDGNNQTHHEQSVFKRIDGVWLYVGEEVRT
jgi:SEC-C motif-containing protein